MSTKITPITNTSAQNVLFLPLIKEAFAQVLSKSFWRTLQPLLLLGWGGSMLLYGAHIFFDLSGSTSLIVKGITSGIISILTSVICVQMVLFQKNLLKSKDSLQKQLIPLSLNTLWIQILEGILFVLILFSNLSGSVYMYILGAILSVFFFILSFILIPSKVRIYTIAALLISVLFAGLEYLQTSIVILSFAGFFMGIILYQYYIITYHLVAAGVRINTELLKTARSIVYKHQLKLPLICLFFMGLSAGFYAIEVIVLQPLLPYAIAEILDLIVAPLVVIFFAGLIGCFTALFLKKTCIIETHERESQS